MKESASIAQLGNSETTATAPAEVGERQQRTVLERLLRAPERTARAALTPCETSRLVHTTCLTIRRSDDNLLSLREAGSDRRAQRRTSRARDVQCTKAEARRPAATRPVHQNGVCGKCVAAQRGAATSNPDYRTGDMEKKSLKLRVKRSIISMEGCPAGMIRCPIVGCCDENILA
ncbi:hypothetical protein EVAR_16132_1 [Eumeta japonica]|uniref:Uncharacterized protein n=1 Tax=Eumeta variegata TaxID=151549 RepID=A0A4C1WE64_EUMVA|nr:hypothetical protein EVAR_16132_1 [Eumeta japonica]